MKLTLEALKGDELRLVGEQGQLAGALAYNRQLQAFLAKEEEPPGGDPPPPDDETAPEPQPNGGIPHREMTPHG